MATHKGKAAVQKGVKVAVPAEEEYLIESKLARYIDREDLEKLLKEIFEKEITAYISTGI
jgi:hypothetical protein